MLCTLHYMCSMLSCINIDFCRLTHSHRETDECDAFVYSILFHRIGIVKFNTENEISEVEVKKEI